MQEYAILRRIPIKRTYIDAGSGGLYFFFQPLVGTLLCWFFLGEQVGFAFWVGSLLILGGVLLVLRE